MIRVDKASRSTLLLERACDSEPLPFLAHARAQFRVLQGEDPAGPRVLKHMSGPIEMPRFHCHLNGTDGAFCPSDVIRGFKVAEPRCIRTGFDHAFRHH